MKQASSAAAKAESLLPNVIFILNISLCLTDSCNLNLNIVTVVEVEDFRVALTVTLCKPEDVDNSELGIILTHRLFQSVLL